MKPVDRYLKNIGNRTSAITKPPRCLKGKIRAKYSMPIKWETHWD